MIGYLKGNVAFIDTTYILIDVLGVGYKVLLPPPTLSKVTLADSLTLFIHTHVREDLLELYGFPDISDLKLFEMIINVSGVGCKTALGIFANGSRSEITNAIFKGDAAFFSGVPRLGQKNAQKIIIELKGKLGGDGTFDFQGPSLEHDEVVLALKVFGYTTKEAVDAYRSITEDGLSTKEKIRMALKYLGK